MAMMSSHFRRIAACPNDVIYLPGQGGTTTLQLLDPRIKQSNVLCPANLPLGESLRPARLHSKSVASRTGLTVALPLFAFPYASLSRATVGLIVVIAISLALLAPGAFSVDSRLFGRREIVIPKSPRSSTK
jgi:hypothetical protein